MKITNTLKEKSQEICSLFAYAIAATLITSPLVFAAPSFQSSQGYNILSISNQKTAAKQNQDKKESVDLEGDGEGHVLPPSAKPKGYSLTDLARLIAPFQASFDTNNLPKGTPFQILFISSTTNRSFTVPAGTPFYVPLTSIDDSPPILGTFPSNRSEAVFYFFDRSQFGGHDYKIIVDGESTPIGSKYLAGPVTTPPLADGGGTHTIVLGVFLSPLSVGTHTVEIKGQSDGDLLVDYGKSIGQNVTFSEDITYTVNVVPH